MAKEEKSYNVKEKIEYKKKMKITKKTNMNDLLMERPELAGMLLSSGMGCFGCPMAQRETLEEGCKAHGMTNKEIDKFVEKLNKKVYKKDE